MALETVSQRKFVKASQVPMGGKVCGYVIGKFVSAIYPDKDCIMMKDKATGEEFVFSGGTTQYFFKNGNKPGYYYEFTRIADRQNKRPGSKPTADFLIAIDRADTIKLEEATVPTVTEAPAANAEQIPF